MSANMAVAVWMIGRDMTFMRTAFVYDVFIYQCYARAFWQGPQRAVVVAPETRSCRSFWGTAPQRFRTFPQEYPVLSLGVFSLPLLTPWLPYNAAFLWWSNANLFCVWRWSAPFLGRTLILINQFAPVSLAALCPESPGL